MTQIDLHLHTNIDMPIIRKPTHGPTLKSNFHIKPIIPMAPLQVIRSWPQSNPQIISPTQIRELPFATNQRLKSPQAAPLHERGEKRKKKKKKKKKKIFLNIRFI